MRAMTMLMVRQQHGNGGMRFAFPPYGRLVLAVGGSLLLMSCSSGARQNTLSPQLMEVLSQANASTLYSLEPWAQPPASEKTLDGRRVLGAVRLPRTETALAAAAFTNAIRNWNGTMAECFDPRQALRIRNGASNYDFLICYRCQSIEVFMDNRLIATTGISGNPETVNALLTAGHIPLSRSGDYAQMRRDADERDRVSRARWLAGMPSGVRAVWQRDDDWTGRDDKAALKAALDSQFGTPGSQILALFEWLGSQPDNWNENYGNAAEAFLLDFPVARLVGALQSATLDQRQQEGAARLFSDWNFRVLRGAELHVIPRSLKDQLLAHVIATKSDRSHDQLASAEAALRQ